MTRRHQRTRLVHPLMIRSWVIGKLPEEIYETLSTRVGVLIDAVRRHAVEDLVHSATVKAATDLLRSIGRPATQLPTIPPEAIREGARVIVTNVVAHYWSRYPYRRGGRYLPPITLRGRPWEVPIGTIHVLDLETPLLHRALRMLPSRPTLARLVAGTPKPSAADALTSAFEVAINEIDLHKDGAWLHPTVQWLIPELLKRAHHSPTRAEKRAAAVQLEDVFRAFLPDLSQHVTHREDELLELLEEHNTLVGTVEALHARLCAEGPTTSLLAVARNRLAYPRFDMAELRGWRARPPRSIVLDLFSKSRKNNRKTIETLLSLARKIQPIKEEWSEFEEFWKSLSEAEQHRLFPVSPPPQPSPPASFA